MKVLLDKARYSGRFAGVCVSGVSDVEGLSSQRQLTNLPCKGMKITDLFIGKELGGMFPGKTETTKFMYTAAKIADMMPAANVTAKTTGTITTKTTKTTV